LIEYSRGASPESAITLMLPVSELQSGCTTSKWNVGLINSLIATFWGWDTQNDTVERTITLWLDPGARPLKKSVATHLPHKMFRP
jgi:hypothetical protein